MNELKRQKNEIKKLFCLSVNRDIDKWAGDAGKATDFVSPRYQNDTYFVIVRFGNSSNKNRFDIRRGDANITICKINIFNFDIWWYVRKLKRYFKNIDKGRKELKKINYLRDSIESIQADFVKEIRKEKLNKIG